MKRRCFSCCITFTLLFTFYLFLYYLSESDSRTAMSQYDNVRPTEKVATPLFAVGTFHANTTLKQITSRHLHVAGITRTFGKDHTYGGFVINTKLRRTIAAALSKYACPVLKNDSNEIHIDYICRTESASEPVLTLFTTMYDEFSKLIAFNNTLTIWSHFQHEIKSILFVAPNISTTENNTFYLVERACMLGWDVAIAPVCNNNNNPIMPHMFHAAHELYSSPWYGYANGDVLFDQSLIRTLDILSDQYNSMLQPFALLSGIRHNVEVQPLHDLKEMHEALLNAPIFQAPGADYYITRRHGFPWHLVPPLAIGLPQIDNYMLWLAKHYDEVKDIDCSQSILAYHQGVIGWKENNADKVYNREVIKEFLKTAQWNVTYKREDGVIVCTTYKLGYLNSPYLEMYKRTMKVFRYYDRLEVRAKCGQQCCYTSHSIVKKDYFTPTVPIISNMTISNDSNVLVKENDTILQHVKTPLVSNYAMKENLTRH